MDEEQASAEFDRALVGDRKVYCLVCKRPFRAVLPDYRTDFRVIWPEAHNAPGAINRAACRGSWMQATLEPMTISKRDDPC